MTRTHSRCVRLRVGAGGWELALSFDTRFAAGGQTREVELRLGLTV